MRAGYGIFHDRLFGQLLGLTRGNPPFQQVSFQQLFYFQSPTAPACNPPQIATPQVCLGPLLSAIQPPQTLTASPVASNIAISGSGIPTGGILPFLISPHLHMPYSQSWNFGIQRDLPGSLLMDVNYVGSRGTRILRLVDGNPPQPGLVSQLLADGIPPEALQFNNLYLGAEIGLLPFDAVNNNAFLHAEVFNNQAASIYHALQANLSKRMGNGLTMQAAYTWAHAIDDSSDPLVPTTGNQGFPRDSLDLAQERGNSDYDVRQRLVLNYTWDLPLGQGRAYLASGFVSRIVAGLQLSGVTTFSGGLPYDIYTPFDTAHTGQPQRPDYNPGATPAPVSNPRTQTGPNIAFFSPAAWGSAGNLGRNHFYGPGTNNWDMVLQKNIGLTERVNLEFRVESYNLFNRVQFTQPDNQTGDTSTFGQSLSEVHRPDITTGARQVQLGMKLSF